MAEEKSDALKEVQEEYERLQKQKFSRTGGVESRTLEALCFIAGEQGVQNRGAAVVSPPLDANKPNIILNLIRKRMNKLIGRFTASAAVYRARPDKKDINALELAQTVNKLLVALDQKLDQPSRTREIFWWLLSSGTAFEYVPWVPDKVKEPMPVTTEDGEIIMVDTITGEEMPESAAQELIEAGEGFASTFEPKEEVQTTGDVGSEILGPLNVFVDHATKNLDEIPPENAIYIARVKTISWVLENYEDTMEMDKEELDPDEDVKIVTTNIQQLGQSLSSHSIGDMIPVVQGTRADDDEETVVVVERYENSSKTNPRGRFTVFIPDQGILFDGDLPYEDGIPLVDFHFEPVTTSFWTKGYVEDLIVAQKLVNKRFSQISEYVNTYGIPNLLLHPDISAEDIPTDEGGPVEDGLTADQVLPKVQPMQVPIMSPQVTESLKMALDVFNDLAGGADLFDETKFPGNFRGTGVLPLMQELMDSEWGPLFKHVAERTARVKQKRLNRVKEFYPAQRTLHYTTRDNQDEVLEFHKSEVMTAEVDFNITVDPSSVMPEFGALREEKLIRRLDSPLGILYQDRRSGLPDPTKIAEDLQFGGIGREEAEMTHRKLQQQENELLYKAQPVPVFQFDDHEIHLDEIEGAMASMEWRALEPEIQQAFLDHAGQHQEILAQEAEAARASMQSEMVQDAVAQATQQSAAQTSAAVTDEVIGQLRVFLRQLFQQGGLDQFVNAQAQNFPEIQ